MNAKWVIDKIKKSGLKGRGGAEFPTGLKWEMVKKAKAKKKYIVCNASEGEPGVFKDGFILENYPEVVVQGIKIALKTIKNSSAFIYLREDYYKKFGEKLRTLIKKEPIYLFKKPPFYLAGEETALLEVIEGRRPEPRIKPPFPVEKGLWGCPTLINNVETFYYVAKIIQGEYRKTRFYSISGDVKNKGVYEMPINYSILRILKETNNFPEFDFFVQAGGGITGEIITPDKLKKRVKGQGAIIVFNRSKTDIFLLMENWVDFLLRENCDKCTPCREGVFRLAEMVKQRKIDLKTLNDLLFVLKQTSFCGLGKGVALPFFSLIKNLGVKEIK